MKKRAPFILITVLWVSIVAAGISALGNYGNTPGRAAAAPNDWPAGSKIQRDAGGMTLVLIAHPRCPCTRATIGELSRLMAKAQGRLKAYVLFIRPEGSPVDWEKTDLWAAAAAIPGVTVLVDDKGEEADRFQAATSGQNLLYSPEGKLLFSGGITLSRGHEGDNAGRDTIISILNGKQPAQNETPVYGCPIFAPDKEKQKMESAK
ncbi:MAG TPA: hypothetical protein VGO50_17705 [Pyrinomonadaceae bacterium]|jgi:hypothetical protein|nr:hypothetical protein [Pyrinomonadaceae bacterium]